MPSPRSDGGILYEHSPFIVPETQVFLRRTEQHSPLGHPGALTAMFAVAAGMILFFRRRGWLGSRGIRK